LTRCNTPSFRSSIRDGARLLVYKNANDDNQLFRLKEVDHPNKIYKIFAESSNKLVDVAHRDIDKFIDYRASGEFPDLTVIQSSVHDDHEQTWRLERVD
jgi:hypothetical protein